MKLTKFQVVEVVLLGVLGSAYLICVAADVTAQNAEIPRLVPVLIGVLIGLMVSVPVSRRMLWELRRV